DQLHHRVQGARALGIQVDPVPGDGPRSAGAVHGEGELVALGDELGGGAPRGGEAHPTPSPSVRSIGRSAWITKAMCSSSGTPSSSAPWRTSSRFTPRANALSLSFFFTEATSRSPQLLDGRTSAQATRKPHSSSTANNAFAIVVSRGTPLKLACPRIARHSDSGSPLPRNSRTPQLGCSSVGECASLG